MCECRAIKTYATSWHDGFDYWWDNNKADILPKNTPTFMEEKYKSVAQKSWNKAQEVMDECTEAISISPYVAFG